MIHGMNLSVERGMIYGLLGVNGAPDAASFPGKTSRQAVSRCFEALPVGVLADGSIAKEVSMAQVRKDCPEGLEDYFFNIMRGGRFSCQLDS